MRFKRDRTGVISAVVVHFLLRRSRSLAPLITKLYGKNPYTLYGQDRTTRTCSTTSACRSAPSAASAATFWFGVEPNLGRDVFTMLIYGMRTSLFMALARDRAR